MNSPTVVPNDEAIAELRLPYDFRPGGLKEDSNYNFWFLSSLSLMRMARVSGSDDLAVVWQKNTPFSSSSKDVNNKTYLQTGQTLITGLRDPGFTHTAATDLWNHKRAK